MGIIEITYIIVFLSLFFNFSNGFQDASNIVSTIISSKAMGIRPALLMASVFVFLGSFLLGTAVAKTIGLGIVSLETMTVTGIAAAVTAATAWNIITWSIGLPSSSSHALIGGLMGAAIQHSGLHSIEWISVLQILSVIFVSPLIGFFVSYHMTTLNFLMFRHMRPVVATSILKKLQIAAGALLAVSHGTNDAQKAMGLITLSLLLLYRIDPQSMAKLYAPGPAGTFTVPAWVVLACSISLALGMLSGGKRIIRTLGTKLFKVKPIHGFGAMLSTALVVYGCSLFGFPVSTTHVASSAVVGGGASQRMSIVRWGLTKDIMLAWIFTIPASAAIAYFLSYLLNPARIF
jgi:PiT family inorganic phosphate transporter